ncbi:unnamed protein product [Ophioblennius macclurei]
MATVGAEEEVLWLLQEYCTRRRQKTHDQELLPDQGWRRWLDEDSGRSRRAESGVGRWTSPSDFQLESGGGLLHPSHFIISSYFGDGGMVVPGPLVGQMGGFVSRPTVTDQLLRITDSTSVPERSTDTQDDQSPSPEDVVRRLVDLVMSCGDDMDVKIRQNPVLQQQLQNLSYSLFQRLASGVQVLVRRASPPAESPDQAEMRSIAWAFEVTSRLSAAGVVHRRRALSFGERYIQENHSDWVRQHGGWDRVFDLD